MMGDTAHGMHSVDLLKQIEGHGPNMEKLCGFVKTFVELMGQDKSAMAELKQMLEETNGQMMEFKARAARLLVPNLCPTLAHPQRFSLLCGPLLMPAGPVSP